MCKEKGLQVHQAAQRTSLLWDTKLKDSLCIWSLVPSKPELAGDGTAGAEHRSPCYVPWGRGEALYVSHPLQSRGRAQAAALAWRGLLLCASCQHWWCSRQQMCLRGSISYQSSHAGDWFGLLIDSCDNEVIVRRQSVHRNVFMSCGLGSWAFCVQRGSVSRWLGQSKG